MDQENTNLFEFAAFDELESEHIAAPRYSYWKSVWRTFFKNKFTVAVAVFLLFIIAFALIQPTISGYSPIITPNINDASLKFVKPCAGHIFGTDHVGNEVFDAVWAGARNSIIISFVCTGIIMLIGIPVGALWGFSKSMDRWMIEVYNVISNVPFLLLAMILSYVLGAGMRSLIITMTCTEWIFVAYFIRTQVMIIRDREYNMASKCLGTSTWTMIIKNILPYLISVIMTYISREIPSLISYEVFLSYMG
ncbi:MAG: ABC transporter permease, partial [Lachnospiraceae bacterium]|nr:ABC transporter permease [Lachnospiraceae bacterium]